ncbi:MAG: TonB family protein [Thermodesulfobacteriota bacterium]|jgi:TonB family protein
MRRRLKREERFTLLVITASLVFIGFLSWILFLNPKMQIRFEQGWRTLTRETKRILGWKRGEIPPEEKRIREEVILRKMREESANYDWRALAPEYPRPRKLDALPEKERVKALTDSTEFKEMEKELIEYLKKKEGLLNREPSLPLMKDPIDLTHLRDQAAERVVERLLNGKEKATQEKPIEENILLGIKGPLSTRKILERPSIPGVKVKVEAEVELTLHVLPNGMVDRVIPTVKGDAELERIAIQYVRQWRFAPLPKDQPQVEQWGTIPIRFRLQ